MPLNGSSRSGGRIFFGLLVICVGVIMLLDRLDIIYAYDYLRYWPLIIVLFGAIKFLRSRRAAGYITGILIMCFGGLLSLDILTTYDVQFWEWWPILIILLGASLLFNSRHKTADTANPPPPEGGIPDLDSTVSIFSFMSGNTRIVASQDFRGGEITSIMGGCKLDLRQASIKTTQPVLDLFALWGGIEILVPRDWYVVTTGHALMGGMDNKTFPPGEATQKQLVIRGWAIMGGVDIRNL